MCGDWKEIETAPKDGRDFIATGWDFGRVGTKRHTVITYWSDEDGFVERGDYEGGLHYLDHWMPLPAAPGTTSRPTPDTQTAAIGAEAMREALRYAFETGADTKASYEQGDGDRRWSAELDDEFEVFMRNYPALSQPVAAPQAEMAGGESNPWSDTVGAFVDFGFQKVSRNPSDCETALAYRYAILEALATPPQPEGGTVTKWPSTCDGIEQDAFEEWAKGERMVMDTHPIHWLFLNAETAAARKGWKAGLLHAANRLAALTPEKSK